MSGWKKLVEVYVFKSEEDKAPEVSERRRREREKPRRWKCVQVALAVAAHQVRLKQLRMARRLSSTKLLSIFLSLLIAKKNIIFAI
jgi:hypothetical protein